MTLFPDPGDDPVALYRRRVEVDLPAAAAAGGWALRDDHCFARVLLDRLCGGVWYDHIPKPAWKHLTDDQARALVTMADRLLAEGPTLLDRWNRDSLGCRGKLS
ncbi:MAG: hypothetical protein AAF532_14660 [Planctomycetota bacterium]